MLCGQVPALALSGVTCQRKSLKAGGKRYSCMVPALFLAKVPCTESVGLGKGVRAKCQVLLAVLHRARIIPPRGASSGPCGMFRVMPAGSYVCLQPWQLCWDSWRGSTANPSRSWPA